MRRGSAEFVPPIIATSDIPGRLVFCYFISRRMPSSRSYWKCSKRLDRLPYPPNRAVLQYFPFLKMIRRYRSTPWFGIDTQFCRSMTESRSVCKEKEDRKFTATTSPNKPARNLVLKWSQDVNQSMIQQRVEESVQVLLLLIFAVPLFETETRPCDKSKPKSQSSLPNLVFQADFWSTVNELWMVSPRLCWVNLRCLLVPSLDNFHTTLLIWIVLVANASF